MTIREKLERTIRISLKRNEIYFCTDQSGTYLDKPQRGSKCTSSIKPSYAYAAGDADPGPSFKDAERARLELIELLCEALQ